MKLIRIFIAFVVISLVIGVGSAFNGQAIPNQDEMKLIQVEYEEQKEVESITQNERLEENEIVSTEKDLSTEIVDKEIKQEEVENKQEVSVPKQTVPEQQEQVKNNAISQPKQEETKEINVWEELGMSEDEYYNKPMWKWAKIDFSIEEYGSEDACFNACIKYGESTGMGFSCSTINSPSGRYLGEMIKLF